MALAPAFFLSLSSPPNWTRAAFHGSETPELYVRTLMIRTRESAIISQQVHQYIRTYQIHTLSNTLLLESFGERQISGRESVAAGKKSPLLLTVKNVMVLVPWGSLTTALPLYAHIATALEWHGHLRCRNWLNNFIVIMLHRCSGRGNCLQGSC